MEIFRVRCTHFSCLFIRILNMLSLAENVNEILMNLMLTPNRRVQISKNKQRLRKIPKMKIQWEKKEQEKGRKPLVFPQNQGLLYHFLIAQSECVGKWFHNLPSNIKVAKGKLSYQKSKSFQIISNFVQTVKPHLRRVKEVFAYLNAGKGWQAKTRGTIFKLKNQFLESWL